MKNLFPSAAVKWAAVGLAAGLGWGRAVFAEDGGADGLTVRIGKTVEISSSYRYCWFATLHAFSTGELMATMRMSQDEINPEGDFSAYCISKDGGQTWSQRYTMGAGANVDSAYTSEPRKDGALLSLYGWVDEPYPAGQARQFRGRLTRISRGSLEFTQYRDVLIRLAQPAAMIPAEAYPRTGKGGVGAPDAKLTEVPLVVPWGPIVVGLDGGLLAPTYYKTRQQEKFYSVGLIRSTDDGRNWDQLSTIAGVEPEGKPWPWMGSEGPNECSIVRLADDRLYAIFRTGGHGFMGQSWSSDDGRTWSAPESTSFAGVAPRLRKLSNGVLACTYGRPGPVTIMFNLDGTAKKWSHLTPLFSGTSTRYTDLVEVQPGRLLVVYDSVPYSWDRIPDSDAVAKNRIYGTFVEVEKR